MFRKIALIRPLPDYWLHAVFEDGAERRYDVKPLFDKWEPFKALLLGDLFGSVRVDEGGYGISWNDEVDLACDELYFNGTSD